MARTRSKNRVKLATCRASSGACRLAAVVCFNALSPAVSFGFDPPDPDQVRSANPDAAQDHRPGPRPDLRLPGPPAAPLAEKGGGRRPSLGQEVPRLRPARLGRQRPLRRVSQVHAGLQPAQLLARPVRRDQEPHPLHHLLVPPAAPLLLLRGHPPGQPRRAVARGQADSVRASLDRETRQRTGSLLLGPPARLRRGSLRRQVVLHRLVSLLPKQHDQRLPDPHKSSQRRKENSGEEQAAARSRDETISLGACGHFSRVGAAGLRRVQHEEEERARPAAESDVHQRQDRNEPRETRESRLQGPSREEKRELCYPSA